MNKEEIKILTKDNDVITLRELFERKEEARKEMAKLPFEEKIKILVQLQKIAVSWGGKKDVIVWELLGKKAGGERVEDARRTHRKPKAKGREA